MSNDDGRDPELGALIEDGIEGRAPVSNPPVYPKPPETDLRQELEGVYATIDEREAAERAAEQAKKVDEAMAKALQEDAEKRRAKAAQLQKPKRIRKSGSRLRMRTQSDSRDQRARPVLRFKHRGFTVPSRGSETQSNASSARLQRYLVGKMKKSPAHRPKAQKLIYQDALKECGDHSFRQFSREWEKAINLVHGCKWSAPGAPRGKRKSVTED